MEELNLNLNPETPMVEYNEENIRHLSDILSL